MRFRGRIATPTPLAVLALFTGFAAGRVDLLDGLSPAAIPLFVVNLLSGTLPPWALGAGILLGAASAGARGGVALALGRLLASGLGLLAARALVRAPRANSRSMAMCSGVCQAAGAWVVPVLVQLPDRPLVAAWVAAAIEVLLAPLAASLFVCVAESFAERRKSSSSLLTLGVLLVLGLQGLTPPLLPIRLDCLAAALVVLIGAAMDGLAGGAVTGTAMSLALLVGYHTPAGGPTLVSVAAAGSAFAAGGLAAGAFRPLGRSFAAAAFMLAFAGVIFWGATSDAGSQGTLLLPALAGAIMAALAPLPDWASALMLPSEESAAERRGAPPSVQDRVQRLAEVLQGAGRAFEQAAPARTMAPAQVLGGSFESVQKQVCQGCSLYRRCWETDFFRTVQTFEGLWRRIEEEGRISPRHVPDELTHYCIYPGAILATLNSLQELDALQRQWQRRLTEGRTLVAGYVQGVASILEQVANELRPGAAPAAPALLKVRHGLARLPGRGALISGDSVLAEAISPEAFLLVLSDGMGAGAEAARESRHAVALLRQLLGVGFSASLAVQTANAALLLAMAEDTFTTIDLALVDLVHSRVEFIKTGAVSSLVRRGSDITFVRGSAPPAGILHQVRVDPEIRPVAAGDVLVMVTDGLWQRGIMDQERWLSDCLRQTRSQDPQTIADGILARAIEVCDPGDDMTVLVACLDGLSGAPLAATRPGEGKVPRPAIPARR